jgi:hypothetical protein
VIEGEDEELARRRSCLLRDFSAVSCGGGRDRDK